MKHARGRPGKQKAHVPTLLRTLRPETTRDQTATANNKTKCRCIVSPRLAALEETPRRERTLVTGRRERKALGEALRRGRRLLGFWLEA
jgi:hypothetical protein